MKSYEFGLLQTAALRGLKGYTKKLLRPYSITTYEWGILGLLFEKSEGYTFTELSEVLYVSKPFVTKAIRNLVEKNLVVVSQDEKDRRSSFIRLSSYGKQSVPKIESYLRREIYFVFKDINKLKLLAHVSVLKGMVSKLEKTIKETRPPEM